MSESVVELRDVFCVHRTNEGDAAAKPGAARHLAAAERILTEVGARNELARTRMGQATLRHADGDPAGARALLREALEIFEALGTLDGPPRVRAMLAELEDAR